MKTKPTLLTLSLILLGLLMIVPAGVAQTLPGDVLYSTDFTGPNGTTPEDWVGVFSSPIMEINNNRYQFRRNSGGTWRSAVYDGEGADTWSNYSVKTEFTVSDRRNYVGVIARWDGNVPANNSDIAGGYIGYVRPATDGFSLIIQSGFQRSSSQSNSTILATKSIADGTLVNNGTYQIELILEGPSLSLFLYNSGGNEIASVVAIDSTWSSGNPGVFSYLSSDGRQTFFNNFEVTSQIPEAATFGLLGGALLLGGTLVARRRRRV